MVQTKASWRTEISPAQVNLDRSELPDEGFNASVPTLSGCHPVYKPDQNAILSATAQTRDACKGKYPTARHPAVRLSASCTHRPFLASAAQLSSPATPPASGATRRPQVTRPAGRVREIGLAGGGEVAEGRRHRVNPVGGTA